MPYAFLNCQLKNNWQGGTPKTIKLCSGLNKCKHPLYNLTCLIAFDLKNITLQGLPCCALVQKKKKIFLTYLFPLFKSDWDPVKKIGKACS